MIKDYVKKYMDYMKLQHASPATIAGYDNDLMMYMRWAAEAHPEVIEIADITRKVIREYIDYLEGYGYASKTIMRRVTVLRNFLQYAAERDDIKENPFWKMNIKIRSTTKPKEVLDIGEVNRILFAVHNQPARYSHITHVRDIALLEILFSTGMRVAELASLTFEQWDATAHCFRFTGKGSKDRIAYLENKEVVGALQNYMAMRAEKTGPIFIDKQGKPISTGAIREVVKKYARIAHIDKRITPHTFRRSYATLLIDSGMDIAYVQRILGHASISTTQYYVRLSEQSTRKAIRQCNPRDYMSFA